MCIAMRNKKGGRYSAIRRESVSVWTRSYSARIRLSACPQKKSEKQEQIRQRNKIVLDKLFMRL
jgi:hypothetical protein